LETRNRFFFFSSILLGDDRLRAEGTAYEYVVDDFLCSTGKNDMPFSLSAGKGY